MTKRGIALGVCVMALLLLSGARQAAETDNALTRTQGMGWWSVSMSRSGGMRPAKQTVLVNSSGEISVHAEHYKAGGAAVVDCSVKVKLAEEDFLKLKEAVRASKPTAWREDYSDEKHPICCDQPTLRLTFSRRESRDSTRIVKTSWYPGSSELRPAEVVQELWNKASERCAAGEASQ